jgi:two-component system chemotaxis sensor kinase CheA
MKDDELKKIFLAEAQTNFEDLNRLFTQLEKNNQDRNSIDSIFRITHTLKANAAAMGFDGISQLSHVLEDIFSLIKTGKMDVTPDTFNVLFRANDKLGELIDSIKSEKIVSHRGMLTKLKVLLRTAKEREDLDGGSSATESTQSNQKDTDKENEQGLESDNPTEKDDSPKTGDISFSDYVQVPVEKLDQLMNLVGELSIERDRLITKNLILNSGRGTNEYASLYRISADLQYGVMSVRLVKVNVLFNKFHRIVRDVANFEKKKVDLVLEGTEIEIDRNVLQTISDSLIHLVRNAISHGLETPAERLAKGKTEIGILKLVARNDRDSVAIEIKDDGAGVDAKVIRKKIIQKGLLTEDQANQLPDSEVVQYIFAAGFSSKDSVSEVSGRGVGMDVVKKAIDTIGGEIETKTEVGKGTTFTLYLPASMAVKKALLFEIEEGSFAIPLSFIESVIYMQKNELHKVGKGLVGTHAGDTVSVIFLRDLFRVSPEDGQVAKNFHLTFNELEADKNFHTVLISMEGRMVGFVVDKLLQQKEIIEKPMAGALKNSKFISGATILGDGSVCLVLDVPSIVRQVFRNVNTQVLTT